jgi:transglutaminase-like putative cysteine protease
MAHHVSARIELELVSTTELILAVAPTAATPETETLSLVGPSHDLEVTILSDAHGGRLHQVHAPAGPLTVMYSATIPSGVTGPSATLDPADRIRYLRPSRYAQADILLPFARTEFQGVPKQDVIPTVRDWVANHLAYVPGSSKGTDSALETYLARAGVCRDYAHLTIALLRSLDVPARMAAVYAPGLYPMDFHAVTEAWDGQDWVVLDATGLAPRQSLLRISTGRDAADTAFLSSHGDDLVLTDLEVTATVDDFSIEDVSARVVLAN